LAVVALWVPAGLPAVLARLAPLALEAGFFAVVGLLGDVFAVGLMISEEFSCSLIVGLFFD
jgi:hypothetical protein